MKILLLGSGGREHALAWKMQQSPLCEALFIAPGNAGTFGCGTNVDLSITDFPAIKSFIIQENIELLVVGSEAPLVSGITNFVRSEPLLKHVRVVGPSAEAALLEGSKAFAKRFMAKYGVPTAAYREISDCAEGEAFLETLKPPYVLKADGLAAGKGVLILDSLSEAKTELREMLGGKFGEASRKVVIEEFLDGIEFSVFALTDGKTYKLLPEAKDYKRIGEGDKGLNTGGMGAVSPVPFCDAVLWEKVVKKIVEPTISGIAAEGLDYTGFVFFGLIRVGTEPVVIEYNCRLGDPETQAILPRISNDLVDIFQKTTQGDLAQVHIQTDPRTAVAVVLTAGGYPEDYRKGDRILGIPANSNSEKTHKNAPKTLVFQAGTCFDADNNVSTQGGRVLAVTSLSESVEVSARNSMKMAESIAYEGKYYRRDIGDDLLSG
jgi:phosphoribosylamine---glycine ligase